MTAGHPGRPPGTAGSSRRDIPERIVAAALTLLAERGLSGITMSAVAHTAGVARQTLYNHFPDVDSILSAAITSHGAEDDRAVTALLDTIPSATGRLEHLLRHTVATAAQHGTMPTLHDGLAPQAQQAWDLLDRRRQDLLERLLADGRASGEFRDSLDPVRDAALLRHLLQGAADLAASRPDHVPDITDTALRTLLAATTAPTPVRPATAE